MTAMAAGVAAGIAAGIAAARKANQDTSVRVGLGRSAVVGALVEESKIMEERGRKEGKDSSYIALGGSLRGSRRGSHGGPQ